MHADFRQIALDEQERNVERNVRRAFLRQGNDPSSASTASASASENESVVLRLCCVSDDAALDRLAALEGRASEGGRYVVAEVNGTIVAALPLACGKALADPFRPTAHLIPLLELRAKQIGTICQPSRSERFLGAVRGLTPARH